MTRLVGVLVDRLGVVGSTAGAGRRRRASRSRGVDRPAACIRPLVLDGIGTPAPVAPTEHLVVGGAYRHVRNPMYLAVGSVILGQAFVLGQAVLLVWLAGFGLMVEAFVRLYEEPTLSDRYGADVRRRSKTT